MFVARCEYREKYEDYRGIPRTADWKVGLVVTNGDTTIILSTECA